MTIWHSFILGIVEGVTEFLPISSTGHLTLVGELLQISQSDFTKSFEIIIQLGAILAVVVLYWQTLLRVENLKKIIVAFIPTGIIGLLLYKVVKTYLLGNQIVVLSALFIGGLALIVFEFWYQSVSDQRNDEILKNEKGIESISYKQSLWIGLCQSLAMIPGVSRSAATIVGGLLSGLSRQTIVEFSFLLAVPTMLAASGLDIIKNVNAFSVDQFMVLAVGFGVSFVVAMISIKFLLKFIKNHNFVSFGIYRVLLAVIFWLMILR